MNPFSDHSRFMQAYDPSVVTHNPQQMNAPSMGMPSCLGADDINPRCGSCSHQLPCHQENIRKRMGVTELVENITRASDHMHGGTHYKDMGVEPWDVVDTWPVEQRIGAYRHGALKYLMRMGSKDEQLQEIRKAGHYIEKLIEVLQDASPRAEKSPSP